MIRSTPGISYLSLTLSCCFLSLAVAAVEQVQQEQQQNDVWVDVRSSSDFRQGHREGAINIPHGDIGHKIFEAVPDTFKTAHIYDGDSGTFADLALEMLMEIGNRK